MTIGETRCVYAIQCRANGKVHIGMSVSPETAIKSKLASTRHHVAYKRSRNELPDDAFCRDYAQYGEKSFVPYLLEVNIPYEKGEERKLYWMRQYNSSDPKYGYNQKWHSRGELEVKLELPENRFEGEHSLVKWERLNKEQKTEVLNTIELLFAAQKGLPGDNFVAMWLQLTAEEKAKVKEYAELIKAAREET